MNISEQEVRRVAELACQDGPADMAGLTLLVEGKVSFPHRGEDDMEETRRTLFATSNLAQPYHSINTDVNKRIRYLE